MRFLADESCDFGVVRALREAGHDIVAVAELSPRADDEAVADLALREDRILLTEDKDFGRLAFATTRKAGSVILIRFPGDARTLLGQGSWLDHGDGYDGVPSPCRSSTGNLSSARRTWSAIWPAPT